MASHLKHQQTTTQKADEHMHMPPAEHLHILNSLPFKPIEHEILYVEAHHDEALNTYIRQHYTHIARRFEKQGYRFVYLPILAEQLQTPELCHYHRPSKGCIDHALPEEEEMYHRYILQHIVEQQNLKPGLLSYKCGCLYNNDRNGFFYFPLDISGTLPIDWQFQNAIDYKIEWCRLFWPVVYYSIANDRDQKLPNEEEQDESEAARNFSRESIRLMEEIRVKVDALRKHGIQEALIRHLFEPETKLSRLRITCDYRILLTDYQNTEIKMGALPKAVFFLFLRHPEGIIFKNLPDYQTELNKIYQEISGRFNLFKLKDSVKKVTDPTQNSINEKCARIRESFLQHIDESIARNYFVTGERGLAKKIILPRDLVEWECDF